ncbi:MAG: dihydropteroate synthase [Gemmatimonadetes bacterium]|nr:dihydropteroate synthase [Gemmatimonadota bacterium]
MGIVNATPDSFYDGGRHHDTGAAVAHAATLLEEGADILDIGGESTRPGATEVPARDEIARTVPVIRALRAQFPALPLSIDTRKSAVARAALDAGANIVNDVSALQFDPALADAAAASGAGLILNHMRGEPGNMQNSPRFDDLWSEIRDELGAAVRTAEERGVAPEAICLDPGIGFGKRFRDNLLLIRDHYELRSLGFPILLGPSRKRFLGRILDTEADDRLEGTIAACVAGVLNGADIVRVHDVKAVRRAIRVAEAIHQAKE